MLESQTSMHLAGLVSYCHTRNFKNKMILEMSMVYSLKKKKKVNFFFFLNEVFPDRDVRPNLYQEQWLFVPLW